jgi:hypothetical protein
MCINPLPPYLFDPPDPPGTTSPVIRTGVHIPDPEESASLTPITELRQPGAIKPETPMSAVLGCQGFLT